MNQLTRGVYPTVCKHDILGTIEASVVITADQAFAESCDQPVALITEGNMKDVVSFYAHDFPGINRTIAVTEESVSDILETALLTQSDITIIDINGIKDTLNIKKMDYVERNLLSVKYAKNPINAMWLPCALIAKQIPLEISFEDAVSKIMTANDNLTQSIVEEAINYQLKSMRENVESLKSIVSNVQVSSAKEVKKFILGRMLLNNNGIIDRKGVHIIKTPTGSCKTSGVFDPLMKFGIYKGKKPVYMSHRCSIVSSAMLDKDIAHYEKISPGTEQDMKALKVVVNSTIKPHLSEFLYKSEILCIDEASQVLDHILTGSVDFRIETYNKLKELIANTDTVVLADADANNDLLQLIANSGRTDVTVYEMKADHSDISLNVTDSDSVHSMITSAVAAGCRSLVAMDNKHNAEKLSAGLRKDFSGKEVLTITSDSINGRAQQDWLKNPNAESEKYDVVIYSPAITSSVSITKDVFAENFGIFGGVLTPSDCMQMLRRDRTARRFTVGLQNPSEANFQASDARATKKAQKALHEISEFDEMTISITTKKQAMKNRFCSSFCYNAELDRFNVQISRADKESRKEAKKLRKRMSSAEKAEYMEAILNAVALSPLEVKKARKNNLELDQDTAYRLKRYEIEKCLVKKEIDASDIELYGRGALKSVLKNIEISSLSKAGSTHNDSNEEGMAFQDKTFWALRNRFYKMILDTLEINLQKGGQFTNSQAKDVLASLYAEKEIWNGLGIMPARKTWENCARATGTVNKILEKLFGIKTSAKDANQNGDRQRLYVVQMDRLNRVNEVVNRRKGVLSQKVVPMDAKEITNYTSSEMDNV